jgi:ADP-ribose pyrophosphatase YjhB (NUDIX family)
MHIDEVTLARLRARFGEPVLLRWQGEVSEQEWRLATYNPSRTHDVTLFIVSDGRIALIRKHPFPPDVWRPPGGGVRPGEDFEEAARREALEETGADVELERYLVATDATFTCGHRRLNWATHVFSARTATEGLAARDTDEIAAVRWGTLEELAGPLRERLLATGRAFWRYRVALHDAALAALGRRRV